MRDLRDMMRPHLYNPQGYIGAQHSDHLATAAGIDPANVIRLNANENPYEPLPEIADALVGLPIHEYPDQDLVRMRSALSEYTGRPPGAGDRRDRVVTRLSSCSRNCSSHPGDSMIDCPPTFGMYEFCARISEAQLIPVERRDDWEIDIDATTAEIERTGAKILFIASPNNPTGNLLPDEDARAILDTGIVLVVDETYYEFCGETTAGLAGRVRKPRRTAFVQQVGWHCRFESRLRDRFRVDRRPPDDHQATIQPQHRGRIGRFGGS